MMQGSKGAWYDMVVIEAHDLEDGGSFVVEVECIMTTNYV